MKETSISTKNFGKQNTPELINKIGNYLLLGGTIGGGIIGLPATLLATAGITLVLPAALNTIGTWLIIGGLLGKPLTKLFGTKDSDLHYVLVADITDGSIQYWTGGVDGGGIPKYTTDYTKAYKYLNQKEAEQMCEAMNETKMGAPCHVEEHKYM